MSTQYYFLLNSLPVLPELGERPPISLPQFRAAAADEPSAAALIDAVLMEGDLMAREAALAGKEAASEPVVLTAGQIAGEEPLPAELVVEPQRDARAATDAAWDAYFRYVHSRGRASGCDLVVSWVGFETALRNAVAARRAKALALDALDYFVAPDLADPDVQVDELVAAWAAADNPLAALRALDEGRWRWVLENERYFSFAIDELAGYARKLVLATRWHLLSERDAEPSPSAGGSDGAGFG